MKNYLTKNLFCLLAILLGVASFKLVAQTTYPMPGFTLPDGKSIIITYEVDVNGCPEGVAPSNISNQASVSGANFATVSTDDPDVGGASDPTTTPYGALTLGNLVFEDVNGSGTFDMGDIAIDGVTINLYKDDGDGVLDAGDGAPIATTSTMGGGLYSFNVCPGDYIVEVALANFMSGGALYNAGSPFVSSPIGGAADPDNDVDNDDNGDPVMGFGVATQAVTMSTGGEPTNDGDMDNNTNLTVDFSFIKGTTITISDVTMNEGSGGSTTDFDFIVTRSKNDETFMLTVNTSGGGATSGTDFTAISAGSVSFTAGGSLMETVTVQVQHDAIVEDHETFTVVLSGASAGIILSDDTGLGTITNDDNATLTLSGGSAQNEGSSGTTAYTFTATLTAAVQGGFNIAYTTNDVSALDGSDYTDNDGMLSFIGTANEIKSWTVSVNGDNLVELDETFEGELGAITMTSMVQKAAIMVGGSPQTSTITNDDAAIIALSGNVNQLEATTPQVFNVTLSNPVDVQVSVDFSTANNTASTIDNDYTGITNQSVVFSAGTTTTQMVNVIVTNDNKVEGDEIFDVSLTGLSASMRDISLGTSAGTGTILNDDNATLTLSGGGAAFEGNSGTIPRIFTATLNNPVQGGFTVAYTTNDGTATTADNDYQDNDGSLSFAGTANEMQTLTVDVVGDLNIENDENYNVALGAISGTSLNGSITIAGSPQTGTITNDDREISVAVSPSSVLEDGATNLIYTFTRTGYAVDTVTVFFSVGGTATFNTDYTQTDALTFTATMGSVLFNFTETTKTITIDPMADIDIEPNETVELNITPHVRYKVGSPSVATGTIENDDNNVSLSVAPGSVAEDGTTNLIYSFTRTDVNSGALEVNFNVSGSAAFNTDYTQSGATTFSGSAGTVTFSGVSPTAMVTVDPTSDVIVELAETVTLTVAPGTGYGLGAPTMATGTITNDDAATITITNPSIAEGNAGTKLLAFSINLSQPSDADVSMNYQTMDVTAEDENGDGDYLSTSGSLTFTPSQTSKQVNVTIQGDCAIEASQSFSLILSNLMVNSRTISFMGGGSTLTGTGTISNDDATPALNCPADIVRQVACGATNTSVTLPLASATGICLTPVLEFRHRPVNSSNVPTGSFSAYFPATGNTKTFALGRYEIQWRVSDGTGVMSCSYYLQVNQINPVTPQISGIFTICRNITNIPYSVRPQPGITNYQWSYSGTGAIIQNNGSPNVTIAFSATATGGQLKVEIINPCGGASAIGIANIQIGNSLTCTYVNCLISNLFVSDNTFVQPGQPQIFKVNNNISSNATINSPKTILFKSGNSIDLLPGFKVNQGAVFVAEIEGCPIVFPLSSNK